MTRRRAGLRLMRNALRVNTDGHPGQSVPIRDAPERATIAVAADALRTERRCNRHAGAGTISLVRPLHCMLATLERVRAAGHNAYIAASHLLLGRRNSAMARE